MRRIIFPVFLITVIISSLVGCNAKNNLVFTSTIESTQIDVNSEISGKVVKINAEEGADVKAGDILVAVDSSSAQIQVKQAEDALKAAKAKLDEIKSGSREEQVRQAKAAVDAAKARLDELKAGSRSEQVRQAKAAVEQAQNAVSAAQKNYDYRLKNLNNAKELFAIGGSSQQQIDDLSNLVDTAYQQLKSSQEQLNMSKAQLDLLVNGATSQSIRAAEAAYQQAKAQYDLVKNGATSQSITVAQATADQAKKNLELAKLQLDKFNIKAPVNGRLVYENVDPGEVIFPGSNVATISIPDDVWARFYVPETSKHLVEVGKEVMVKSKAYPNENIKGKMTYVADEAEFTPKNVETKEAKENTVFEVKVKILNLVDKLKPGMTVDIVLE